MPVDPEHLVGTVAQPDIGPSAILASAPVEIDDIEELVGAFQVGPTRSSASGVLVPSLHRRAWRIDADRAKSVYVTPCPVCDGQRAFPTFGIEGIRPQLVTCGTCGLGRLDPLPGPDEIRSYYPSEYYGVTGSKFEPFVEAMVRFVGARHSRLLARGVRPGGRVLDIGCGRGVTLTALADRGFEVHGVEMSREAALGADPRAKIRIASRLTEAEFPEAHFDQVVMWHVLEHVPDPRATLDEIHRILRPDGRLVIAVPNFSSLQARWAGASWFHLDLPRHLYHFPLAALLSLLERCGFAREAVYHFSLRQNPFGWVQSALNRCSALPPNSLYQLLHRRPDADHQDPNRRVRIQLRLACALGMPIGLAASMLSVLLRRGATVSVVARKRG